MDATHRPEIEVVSALFDSDYDANRAVNMLIEGQNSVSCSPASSLDCSLPSVRMIVSSVFILFQGEWETSSKKKKNRQPSANSKSDSGAPRGISSADVDGENWDDETPTKPATQADTQRTRNQRGGGSGAPRMRGRGAQDNRGCMCGLQSCQCTCFLIVFTLFTFAVDFSFRERKGEQRK